MGVDIKFSQSYFWLNSWVLANIIQLGTQSFCDRFVDYRLDPGRRLYDQMVMAARCGVANIAGLQDILLPLRLKCVCLMWREPV